MPTEIADVIDDDAELSDDKVRDLLPRQIVPASPGGAHSETGDELLQVIDEFWQDIDTCYDDDWERR